MKKLTLVILAAGIGSRYGGLKQLDKMSLEGDTIIDFSIYDAISSGFKKIVLVIRESFIEDFKRVFDAKLDGKVDIAYVCQELNAIPNEFRNNDRLKSWGTGHALLMAKKEIDGNFGVINADDFYSKEAFKTMAIKLQSIGEQSTNFLMIGYQLENTLSEHGFVSRGQCFVSDNGLLKKVIERTHIENIDSNIYYKDEEKLVEIDGKTVVSMNFWGFTPKIFIFLEEEFYQFLKENNNHLKNEFFIPSVVDNLVKNDKATVEVLTSNSKWLGVTYKEDKEFVVAEISRLKDRGLYPKILW